MKIVFLDAYTNSPGDISFEPITELGYVDIYERTSAEDLESRAKDADIVIVNKFLIDESALSKMPNVKYIVVAATGYNNIDKEAVAKRQIPVSNVAGYSVHSVAQHVFASIFAWCNKIEYYNQEVKKGRWSACPDFCFYDHQIREVKDMTLGIFGFGAIGKKVAAIANAFEMKVIVHTRTIPKAHPDYLSFVDREELFKMSDILTLHCPLTEDTNEVINKMSLKMMKPQALLVNTGRGGLINEMDLFYALDHGGIAGAALDVQVKEPPHQANPLIHHQKTIITPHIAWASKEARVTLLKGIVDNISSFQKGDIINSVY
jgi:glycerate dehydrogenase